MGVQDERAGTRRGAEVGDLGPNQALIERLLRLGASVDEIDAAAERGGLQALTIEILLAPDRHLTIGEVAARAAGDERKTRCGSGGRGGSRRLPRTTVASRASTSRWSGPHSRSRRSSEPMRRFTRARVMGMAVGRIAESEVAMLRSTLEAPLREQRRFRGRSARGLRSDDRRHDRYGGRGDRDAPSSSSRRDGAPPAGLGRRGERDERARHRRRVSPT